MSHQSDSFKSLIKSNESEVVRLHSRIHQTCALRNRSPEDRIVWQDACKTFHSRYDSLAFPGGYNGALDRILSGDPEAMEAAICFLELRPYFFRSGYMFKAILRKAKRAPLNEEQTARLDRVIHELETWRAQKLTRSQK